ncbi:MAG: hypothetical protein LUD25_01875, partial [Coriobacteriaceae bacterium]|nr:hypothetical protein [Coriobacteriaceae bacterium]
QLSDGYGTLKQEYAAALRQRNSLIKREITDGSLFDSWTDSLCVNGARLMLNRIKLFNRLKQHIEEIHPRLADGEDLSVRYLPSWQLFDDDGHQGGSREIGDAGDVGPAELPDTTDEIEEILKEETARLHNAEVQRAQTLVGPHKDELIFFLNNKNARLYASQGQQRTIVLAWKLAEVELVREILDRAPILLLDDVMSELDTARRGMLVQFIRQSTQTFITATDTDCISTELLERSQVIRLPLPGCQAAQEESAVDAETKAAG